MMRTRNLLPLLFLAVFSGLTIHLSAQQESAAPFLGKWALTLDYDNNSAGWLEVRQENEFLDAVLLWRWGSVEPVEYAMITGGALTSDQFSPGPILLQGDHGKVSYRNLVLTPIVEE